MANKIRELRQERNLTLPQLSDQLKKNQNLDITSDALSKYERGDREPKLRVWEILANFFGVSVEYIQGISKYKTLSDILNNYAKETYGTKSNAEINRLSKEITDENALSLYNSIIEAFPYFDDYQASSLSTNEKGLIGSSINEIAWVFATLSVNQNDPEVDKTLAELSHETINVLAALIRAITQPIMESVPHYPAENIDDTKASFEKNIGNINQLLSLIKTLNK